MPPPQRLGEFKIALLRINSWLLVTLKAWLPQRFCFFFLAVLLGLVALSFFLLGGWGSPCRVFPPPCLCGSSFFWVGWVLLAAFSRCFPHGSRVGGGSCFVFLFLLLPLASCIFFLLQLGQYGLPTRKPPGPPRPLPWCVGPDPSPAGSRRSDAPR